MSRQRNPADRQQNPADRQQTRRYISKPGGTSGDKGNAQESDDGSEGEDGEQETETQETEQREVCHVNVIIKMDEFPVSAVLAYYHVRVIKVCSMEMALSHLKRMI